MTYTESSDHMEAFDPNVSFAEWPENKLKGFISDVQAIVAGKIRYEFGDSQASKAANGEELKTLREALLALEYNPSGIPLDKQSEIIGIVSRILPPDNIPEHLY